MVATPLIFDNPLKFGPDSCHKTKGRQIPSYIERERERKRERERERERERALEALHKPHHHIEKGPPTGPHAHESFRHGRWSNEDS